MKRILASLALSLSLATSASALSFQWGITQINFGADNKLVSDDGLVGYCVYLENGSYDSSGYSMESFAPASVGTVVGEKSGTSNKAKLSGVTTFDYGTYNNGDVFGFVLSYVSGGKTYYNISSDTYTLEGIVNAASSPAAAAPTFDFTSKKEASSISKGGGWTAVPEPSTAALALAGLALLLKRRKA